MRSVRRGCVRGRVLSEAVVNSRETSGFGDSENGQGTHVRIRDEKTDGRENGCGNPSDDGPSLDQSQSVLFESVVDAGRKDHRIYFVPFGETQPFQDGRGEWRNNAVDGYGRVRWLCRLPLSRRTEGILQCGRTGTRRGPRHVRGAGSRRFRERQRGRVQPLAGRRAPGDLVAPGRRFGGGRRGRPTDPDSAWCANRPAPSATSRSARSTRT